VAQDPELELMRSQVLVPSLTGCGAQFNQHVYAAITGAPLGRFAELEQKVVGLEPQFTRLFYNDGQATAARDQLESFVLTAELAQRAGAVINVTWQSGGVATPDKSMGRFADVLAYLATSRGVSNLRWVTIQNEPNSTKIKPEQNAAMYRTLDGHLAAAGVREQIRFMGGDLVADKQRVWFEFMAANLADLLDAYSVHIYWDYRDTARFRQRLATVRQIVNGLPESGRKPVFVTEYGVRGQRSAKHPDPGVYPDGTPIGRTRIAAFQHAWFQILAAQHGYAGTSKWDCYFGKYDRGTQAYYAIGPWQDGWPLYPTYVVLRLITMTTEPGWQVVAVRRRRPSARTKHLAAFAGPAGELSILGLDGRGATLNEVSPRRVSYTIGGLPPRTSFTLVVWNRTGDGRNHVVGAVASDGSGVAKVTAPLHAVFALTTKPVPDV
jgi:Glycosyl hydrolase catalytic core